MKILLLTQENCEFCEQAKEILSRLQADYPVKVETLDLNSPQGQTLAAQGGILFPPGVFIDDVSFSYGRVSERKLRRELDKRLKLEDRKNQPWLPNNQTND